MRSVEASDIKKKDIYVVIARLGTPETSDSDDWLFGILDGTVCRKGNYVGLIVSGEIWVIRRTPVYQRSYWSLAYPIDTPWGFVSPQETLSHKEEWRKMMENDEIDIGLDSTLSQEYRIDTEKSIMDSMLSPIKKRPKKS